MHAQRPGRGGDIAIIVAENPLDVFPLQAVHRDRVRGHLDFVGTCRFVKGLVEPAWDDSRWKLWFRVHGRARR